MNGWPQRLPVHAAAAACLQCAARKTRSSDRGGSVSAVEAGMPEISMATVYNCLDALVKCDHRPACQPGPRRHPLLPQHEGALPLFIATNAATFMTWILPRWGSQNGLQVPQGFKVKQCDVSIRGVCADCAGQHKPDGVSRGG